MDQAGAARQSGRRDRQATWVQLSTRKRFLPGGGTAWDDILRPYPARQPARTHLPLFVRATMPCGRLGLPVVAHPVAHAVAPRRAATR